MKNLPLLLILFFLLNNPILVGQNVKFKSLSTNDGLSNNSVEDIENDVNGGLWIATWDGLNYFDGYKFTVFKHDIDNSNSIASNYIIKIKRDANGIIWILTEDSKISRYLNNKQFKNYTFNSEPKDISLSKNGNIIVHTKNDYFEFINGQFQKSDSLLITKEDNDVLKKLLLKEYPNIVINSILKDKSGNIWYATRKNGLFIITNNLKKSQKHHIEHYTQDPYSNHSFNSNEIETLHEDVFGNIWLGLKDGGISMTYRNSNKIFSVAPHPLKFPNIPNETIRAITKDSKGSIWLGYYTKGLFYYNKKSKHYTKFKIKEAFFQPDWKRIRSLFTASDGTVWAGTYAGIIRIKNNATYSLYDAEYFPNFPNNRNYSMYEDSKKQLWIACWGGVAKFNLKTNRFEAFKGQKTVSQYHIRNIKVIDNELILATENNGVKLLDLDKGELKTIKIEKALSQYHVENKSFDNETIDNISNSNQVKLQDLKNGELQTINTKEGLLNNSIYSVYKDEQTNYYWIASLGGLSIYDKQKGVIKNITEKSGLPSQLVYGILAKKNEIWISTTKGIAVINKNNFQVKTLYPKGGWQVSEFSEGAYYQDPKGLLFFGGINGLNYFNPDNIQFNHTKAKIKLIVDGNETYESTIKKSFSENQIDIELIPIKFPKRDSKSIYYKLEGKDKNWLLLNNGKINYTNLDSGNYRFLVKQEPDTNIESMLISFHIEKPFYKTISFYILLSIFTLACAIAFIFLKNKSATEQQKKLEIQILARTEIIENQKRDLLIVNNKLDEKNKKIVLQQEKLLALHNNLKNEDFEIEKFKTFVLSEFQEPITEIIKTSNTLKTDTEAKQNLITQSGKLVNLVSEWNYLNHIKDIGSVKTSAINLFPILKNSLEKFKKSLLNNKVNFNCKIDTSIGWVEIDVLRFRLLLQYFFNDISKYSDTDSNLSIDINNLTNFLEIQLTSNSTILKNNWYSIVHYSPYFKALQVLLSDLKGQLINNSRETFQVTLQIPIGIINTDNKQIESISWKHLNQQDDGLSLNKQNILVFSDAENYATANQILKQDDYNLIFEDSVSNLSSAIKQIHFNLIVFYQATFSKELVYFLNTYKEDTNRTKTPMIYISEYIDYELQEQSIEFGIDTLIQLPASESFITKKITSLISKKQGVIEENKFQQKIFDILTEKAPVTTPNDKLLKKSLEIIKRELHNPSFNVEMLVEQLGVSRVKCYRLFKEILKQSPSDIITSLRLQKAEVLLKTKKLNISEISFECGYNDPKYFGRSFKKYFGKSPKEFKEQVF